MTEEKQKVNIFPWLFRLVKGVVIGTGFIIPGVSGGVFAAIFGIYEPMIRFFGNITKDFWKNVKFFFPVGIGGIISMIVFAKLLGDFFENATVAVALIWSFIGCVLGTLPALYAKAGEQGRKPRHMVIGVVSCALMCLFLWFINGFLAGRQVPTDKMWVWLLSGVLMAGGAIVPGLSPSNFILYLGYYKEMMDRIGSVELGVIIPVLIGAAACVLLLSKAFDQLLNKTYTGMYHFILGIIVASCIMIVPYGGKVIEKGAGAELDIVAPSYDVALALICVVTCIAGIALGYVMSRLEKKYKD
jgi:putative membrane protein